MKHSIKVCDDEQRIFNKNQIMNPELLALIERVQAVVNDRLLRLTQVKVKTGLGTSTIWKYVKHGTFPPPIRIGSRSSCWKESEISAWIDANAFASRSQKPVNIQMFVALMINSKIHLD